jgi:uncharacterized protein (DUF924 family)
MKEEKYINKILDFWFGEMKNSGVPDKKKQKMWWQKDKNLDKLIKKEFEILLKRAKSGEFEEWTDNPEGMLAVVILLDQFSRHIYRDTVNAFSQDEMALNIVISAMLKGFDKQLVAVKRTFFYMPLMHSEDIDIQIKSVESFSELEKEYIKNDETADIVKINKKYAIMHYEIIKRFGRYPHRNMVLGRESTAEEIEFLKEQGSSF